MSSSSSDSETAAAAGGGDDPSCGCGDATCGNGQRGTLADLLNALKSQVEESRTDDESRTAINEARTTAISRSGTTELSRRADKIDVEIVMKRLAKTIKESPEIRSIQGIAYMTLSGAALLREEVAAAFPDVVAVVVLKKTTSEPSLIAIKPEHLVGFYW